MTTTPSWIEDGSAIPDPFGYGERAVTWLRRLKHPKNPATGHPFVLDAWAERIIRRLYGPRDDKGNRIVRRLVLLLPRGNRKTSLCAAITLLHLCGPERIVGGLVLSAASALEQARELFDEAALVIQHDRRLAPHLKISKSESTITCRRYSTRYRALSADGGVQHGKTPAVVIADELHVWRGRSGRDLWESLDSSLVKTPNTLMIVASTAGRGQDNLAWETVSYALKVQTGEIEDAATLPVIFMADKDCDWRDPALHHAINPGLAYGYPDPAAFADKVRKAEHSPSDLDAFLQFNLNVWHDKNVSAGFVDMDLFDAGATEIDLAGLEGRDCWLAVDLSVSDDLTALVAAFRDDDGTILVVPFFFCPSDALRLRADRDGVAYPTWAAAGHITPTEGPIIDHGRVGAEVRALCARFNVLQIAFDPARAALLMSELLDEGLPVTRFDQSWRMMVPAIDALERAIKGGTFRHDGNPVLRWNFENIATVRDRNDNVTFHKGKSTDRIDGAVATAMAVSLATTGETGRSIYDDPNFDPVTNRIAA